jgi:hypothetical protein
MVLRTMCHDGGDHDENAEEEDKKKEQQRARLEWW